VFGVGRYEGSGHVDDQKKSLKPEEKEYGSSIHWCLRIVDLRLGVFTDSTIREICGKGCGEIV
jgi:hypothetical protein